LVALISTLLVAPLAARAMTAREIYDAASPSVVVIVAADSSNPDVVAYGSGSLVDADGLVLTNFHVLCPTEGVPGDSVKVFFKPKTLTGNIDQDLQNGIDATIAATDPDRDLALLSIPSTSVPAAPLALADGLAQPGDPNVAIGSPEDGGPWTLTTGAISNRILDFEGVKGKNVYQIETPINPGNSGGALLDANGALLGVTTSAVKIGKSGLPAANIQFAVANDVVRSFIDTALVSRTEFRALPATEQAARSQKLSAKSARLSATVGGARAAAGCTFGVCRTSAVNALDRSWARMTKLAAAAGVYRARSISRAMSAVAARGKVKLSAGARPQAGNRRTELLSARRAVTRLMSGSCDGGQWVLCNMIPQNPTRRADLIDTGGGPDAAPAATDPATPDPADTSGLGPEFDYTKQPGWYLDDSKWQQFKDQVAPDVGSQWLDNSSADNSNLGSSPDLVDPQTADPGPPSEAQLNDLIPADDPGPSASPSPAPSNPVAVDDLPAPAPVSEPSVDEWAGSGGGANDMAAKKLSASRRALLSSVRWATRPMFAQAAAGCYGKAAALCVRKLAAVRAARPGATAQGARRMSAVEGNYKTAARPFKPAQLASVTRKLAGARKMSGELDAAPPDSAPPADAPPADAPPAGAVAPAPPAVAAASLAPAVSAAPPAPATADNVLDAIFRADFKGAMSMVQGTPALGQYEASVSNFVAAGQDMDKKRFAGARVTLRRVTGPPEMQRLADYWLCKSLRLEGMSVKAVDCFSKAGLTDGVRP